jgi:predicted transcriptional regulator
LATNKAPIKKTTPAKKITSGRVRVTPAHHILIYRLVRQGLTYREVEDRLGYTRNTVMSHFHERRKELMEQRTEEDLAEIDLQLERLEVRYVDACADYNRAVENEDKGLIPALHSVIIKILESKSDLLGLKAPIKTENTEVPWTAIQIHEEVIPGAL